MDLLPKIEIYSAVPYGGEDNNPDEWVHVARNEVTTHIEAVWDIEAMFRPDIPEDDKPAILQGLESYFEEIRLHYALNYTHWKYHTELMIWALRALKPGGKLQIISPDIDWILRYWLADALSLDADKYIACSATKTLLQENEELRRQLKTKPKKKPSIFSRMLKDAKVPESALPKLPREQIAAEVKDKVLADVETEWDFDLWLLQQLYSSGSGEPQDTFKAVFGKRYLSTLLRRSQFIITELQNSPDNMKQMVAKAYKHKSRLVADHDYSIMHRGHNEEE
jgi:hypothetical protein